MVPLPTPKKKELPPLLGETHTHLRAHTHQKMPNQYKFAINEFVKICYTRMDTYRQKNRFVHRIQERKAIHNRNLSSEEEMARATERFHLFEYVIENGFEKKLEPFQRLFAEKVIKLFAPDIIGEREWQMMGPIFCRVRKWGKMYKVTVAVAPRQYGKSFVVARIICARMEAIKLLGNARVYDKQAIYSNGQRASLLLRENVVQCLKERNMLKPHMVETFKQEVMILTADKNDPSGARVSAMFFPSNPKTLRGPDPNVLWGEESAHMDGEVVRKCMLPLLEVARCKMVLISSPSESHDHIFTRIATMRDQTTGLLENDVVNMCQVCSKCEVGDHPEECHHNDRFYPPRKSLSAQKLIMRIYGSENMKTFLAESMGAVIDGKNSFYAKNDIDLLFNQPEIVIPDSVQFGDVVIVTDPNAHDSKSSSDMALIAITVHAGTHLIIGLDSFRAGTADHATALLNAFVKGIRDDKRFQRSRIIFCSEANMGHEACFLSGIVLRNFTNIKVVSRKGDDDYGYFTKNVDKIRGAFELWTLLKKNALHFISDWICANPYESPLERRAKTKNKLHDQLSNYRMYEVSNHGASARPTRIVSGKLDENGKPIHGAIDDSAFCLCFSSLIVSMIYDDYFPGIRFEHKTRRQLDTISDRPQKRRRL